MSKPCRQFQILVKENLLKWHFFLKYFPCRHYSICWSLSRKPNKNETINQRDTGWLSNHRECRPQRRLLQSRCRRWWRWWSWWWSSSSTTSPPSLHLPTPSHSQGKCSSSSVGCPRSIPPCYGTWLPSSSCRRRRRQWRRRRQSRRWTWWTSSSTSCSRCRKASAGVTWAEVKSKQCI